MLIQIHLLQNYAPANLNRDDTGSPKDAFFGGTRRGRISSQCLKRSMRKSVAFVEAFADDELLAVRTKLLPQLVEKALQALNADTQAIQDIVARVPEIGRESTKRKEEEPAEEESESETTAEVKTAQLIFLGMDEVHILAEKLHVLYCQYGDSKKWAKVKIADITKALGGSVPRSVDVAMFGRMTTSEAFEDVQAAVQVAHALSTNTLVEEFDYYTAVDDISGESGAGMIGDVEYNCSTYYKYVNIHWEELVKNLGGDIAVARQAVLALLQAAATAQPTGKQNSFAAHCLPDMILVEVRDKNMPVNYANAFLKPARWSGDRTMMDDSFDKLADYLARVSCAYGLDQDKRAMMTIQDYTLSDAEVCVSLENLQQWLGKQLPES